MRNFVLFLMIFIVFIFEFFLYFNVNSLVLSNQYLGLILFLTALAWCVYLCRKKQKYMVNQYVTITSLFLFSFFVVHFQFYIDYFFGLKNDLSLRYYLDTSILEKSITLSSIALLCFFLGSLLNLSLNIKRNNLSNNLEYSFSFLIIKVFIIIFFFVFIISTPIEYFKGGYGELVNNGGVGYFQAKSNQLFQIFLWSYMICKIIELSQNKSKLTALNYFKIFDLKIVLITLVYFILLISAGDRGPIINITILYFVGYLIISKSQVSLKRIIMLIFLGAMFIQFLGYYREIDGSLSVTERFNQSLELKQNIESRDVKTIIPVTSELANSLRSYHAVIMDQRTNPPLYGKGHLDDIIAIFPGFGLMINNFFGVKFENSSKYITSIMGTDHGMGTTALADIYLNYREIGVILIFFIFGWIFSRLDYLGYSNFNGISLFTKVSFFIFIITAFYLGRSSFMVVLSDIILVYIVIRLSIYFRSKGLN